MEFLKISTRVPLRDGTSIPILGLGTYLSLNGEAKKASLCAIEQGYRLLDTASFYDNEDDVGKAVNECGLARKEIYVVTKLWETDHGKEKATRAFKKSLSRFGLDYVDLYLIHSPAPGKIIETWDALTQLQQQGLIKSLGVSNFNIHHLEKLIKARPDNIPVVNQVELSPFLTRKDLVSYCKTQGIIMQAFSPLTKGECLNNPQLVKMAEKYKKSVAQILIRWSLQSGYVCIPKSANEKRIIENANVFDFEISKDDMTIMNEWNRNLITDWNVIESEWVD